MNWEWDLTLDLNTLLPPVLYFNMSIYEVQIRANGEVFVIPLSNEPISNAPFGVSGQVLEKASVTYVYTSRTGCVYLIILSLTRGGVG